MTGPENRTKPADRTGPNIFRSGPRSGILDQFGLRSEESKNENNDADDSDMDLSDDNPNRDDDATGFGNLLNETPANELSDLVSNPVYTDAQPALAIIKAKKSPVVHAQVDTPAIQPLDPEDEYIQTRPNPEWYTKSGSTAKKLKEIIQKDKLTIADLEGNRPKDTFTMSGTHKGVVYLNQHNVKSFMKLSEVTKFCDGNLIMVRENLVNIVKKNKHGTDKKRLKGREWTDIDVEKSNEMVDKIDKTLKGREQLRRLEEYVGGRPKTVNPRTFVRPMRSDDKEYEFSFTHLPRLSLNHIGDMYLLQVQDKLHHHPLEFMKDFNNALFLFIKSVVIQDRVEDIQLGVESYQQPLNLTKPMMFFEGIDQKIPSQERSVVEDVKIVEICVGSNMEEIKDIELKDVEKLERLLAHVVKRKKNEVKSNSSLVEEANPRDHVKSITTQSDSSQGEATKRYVLSKPTPVVKPYRPPVSFPNRFVEAESVDRDKKFLSSLKKLQGQHPCCGLQSTPKEKNPGSFTLLFIIGNLSFSNVLGELEASVSLRPFPTYAKLSLCELAFTRLSIKLADKLVKRPRGIVKNILVKIDKVVFLVNVVIIDMSEDTKAPIILGSPFFATARAKIDVFSQRISLKIGGDKIVLDCDKMTREGN
nr:hypothetical protein [Tanacetum cinerariifolium]